MKFEYTSDELKGSKRVPDIQNYGNAVPPQNSNATATSPSVQRIVIIAIGLIFLVGGICWWLSQSGSVAQNGGRDSTKSNSVSPDSSEVSHQMLGKKIGLCVGLNKVNPQAYVQTPDELHGCCNDADRFGALLRQIGYSVEILKDSDATISNVGRSINKAAEELAEGDIFTMLISGHGCREDQGNGKIHESWCLYDGLVMDSHIIKAFSNFRNGVRILMVNDQCFSGGVFLEKDANTTARRRYWTTDKEDLSWTAEMAVKSPEFPQLIQFASSRAEQPSVDRAGGIGGAWTIALISSFAKYPQVTFASWFNQAFALVPRGMQEPQWVEKGPVSEKFRNERVFADGY